MWFPDWLKRRVPFTLGIAQPHKVPCTRCGAMILPATAQRTGGLYMPCSRPAVPAAALEAEGTLLKAYERGKAGDWQSAMTLCMEAANQPDLKVIAQLNILICRYHLGMFEGLSERALVLLPKVPAPAHVVSSGLAIAGAYRTGDLVTVKKVACALAREIEAPLDLPTIPNFVLVLNQRMVIAEHASVELFLEIIEAIRDLGQNTEEERGLLQALAQEYRTRRAQSATVR